LAACISIDVLMILNKQHIEPKKYAVSVDATKKNSVPSPFEKIHLVFTINKEIDINKVQRAIQLSINKYCSVKESLNPEIIITSEINSI
jgi:putative redox protein